MIESIKNLECPITQKTCEFCKGVSAQSVKFKGCFREPYKGKWVAEINECPAEQLKEQE